jgi:hypothetical protein
VVAAASASLSAGAEEIAGARGVPRPGSPYSESALDDLVEIPGRRVQAGDGWHFKASSCGCKAESVLPNSGFGNHILAHDSDSA